jgi:hypothetical protein
MFVGVKKVKYVVDPARGYLSARDFYLILVALVFLSRLKFWFF